MNRKMFGLVTLAIALIALGVTSARADSLTFQGMTAIPAPFSGSPYNITALGDIDWILPGVDEKADTSIIPDPSGVVGQAQGPGDYPTFTYTNGKWNAGTNTVTAWYNYPTPYAELLGVPAGHGRIMVWMGDGVPAPCAESNINAWFDGEYPASLVTHNNPNNTRNLMVFEYQTSVARDIWLSTDCPTWGGGGTAGWFGIAVSSAVPEPGAITLLGSGLAGLLAYAWRKRR